MAFPLILLVVGLFVLPPARALIRFGCAQLVTERFDPLVTPGQVSPHVHQIIGGNAFNLTMQPDFDVPGAATCTTCRFKEDKSNYWTATMYFKHPNGTYLRVPQIPNHVIGSPKGGMTVYYLQIAQPGEKVTAFPKGFRMITGNPMLRSKDTSDIRNVTKVSSWATTFRCWSDEDFLGPSNKYPPGAGEYDTVHLPNGKCFGGIRANIFFPTCWDGKNLDTPDHHSHMAFVEGKVDPNMGIIAQNGTCPSSHPIRMPAILYETYWDTRPFNDMWPTDGTQPFVLSMGDPTGYGQHGDYLFGWEGDSLQRAMDNCTDGFGTPENCHELTVLSDDEINKCTVPPKVDEKVEGDYLSALPGCNPLQYGPGPATMIQGCTAISTTSFPTPTPAV
ncbi:hypothetical protein CPB83DRAFT_925410 [Crepidotus variabilis]|uniref:DUF1996 domain-containing protein n=1 Tax=Crepidotus variabilis TaxID=179855 RepID=A0A9P6JRJ0_9AGAR|nr:hypothetical protein CPB83DRAFT_925410 [Crepidotus variabilis]